MQQSAVITIDKRGIIQSVDKNCCALFGYALDDLIGHPVTTIIPTPYREQHDTYISNYLDTKVPKIIGKSRLAEGQRKDGSIFPVRLSVSKVGEGDDIVFIGLIDAVEDKSASVTISTTGQILSCNQHIEELFGHKPNEIIGQPVTLLMPSPHSDRHDDYLKSYLSGGPPKVIGRVRNVPAKHKNGTIFPISLQVEEMKIGNLRLFRGRLESVETTEVVFTIDDSGQIISCNQNYILSFCGYNASELVGQNISVLLPPNYQNSSSSASSSSSSSVVTSVTADSEPVKKQRTGELTSMSISDSCKTPGIHQLILQHKDGSLFPVCLEIFAFPTTGGKFSYSGKLKRVLDGRQIRRKSAAEKGAKFIGDYKIVIKIGEGANGKVKLGVHKDTNKEVNMTFPSSCVLLSDGRRQVAIKILRKSTMTDTDITRTRREMEILKKLDHPHIAKLFEVIETSKSLNIVMEYVPKTLGFIVERGGIPESEARELFVQMVSALQYCHDRNIIHRDIKHQNMLIDDQNNVKLIDFGLGNYMEEGALHSTFCGTPAYAAPEMLLGKKYIGPEVDVWSLGVMLYSMVTGRFPFKDVGEIILARYPEPEKVTPEFLDLIRSVFQVDIQKRATMSTIAKHPWVTSVIL